MLTLSNIFTGAAVLIQASLLLAIAFNLKRLALLLLEIKTAIKDAKSCSIPISSDGSITISSDSLTIDCRVKPPVLEAGNPQRNESPSV